MCQSPLLSQAATRSQSITVPRSMPAPPPRPGGAACAAAGAARTAARVHTAVGSRRRRCAMGGIGGSQVRGQGRVPLVSGAFPPTHAGHAGSPPTRRAGHPPGSASPPGRLPSRPSGRSAGTSGRPDRSGDGTHRVERARTPSDERAAFGCRFDRPRTSSFVRLCESSAAVLPGRWPRRTPCRTPFRVPCRTVPVRLSPDERRPPARAPGAGEEQGGAGGTPQVSGASRARALRRPAGAASPPSRASP